MNVRAWLKENMLVFDGAMGTMIQQRGLKPGGSMVLLLSAPETVTQIHREYVQAGADVATANTFQAHVLKLPPSHSVEAVVSAGGRCARASGVQFVALDVGPMGQLSQGNATLANARLDAVPGLSQTANNLTRRELYRFGRGAQGIPYAS